MAQNPSRAIRFANAMKVMTSRPEFDLSYATDYYDWAALGEAQIVDVGGAKGHFALTLAARHRDVKIIVQDMGPVIKDADAGEFENRVQFMTHDLFEQQVTKGDVFFFRWIFHNWSDRHCIRILKAQIPALRPGTRIILQEALMPEKGSTAQWKERDLR